MPPTTLQRRRFLRLLVAAPAALLSMAAGLATFTAPRRARALPAPRDLLEQSEFAYISPLLADGSESTCHAELWYAWIDGAVVVNVSSEGWKARALERGLDRARIWIGDHGRWRGWLGKNEAFRKAPSFVARGETSRDEQLLGRLLAIYEQKYPDEIGDWRESMRSGLREGSRVLIRYTPVD